MYFFLILYYQFIILKIWSQYKFSFVETDGNLSYYQIQYSEFCHAQTVYMQGVLPFQTSNERFILTEIRNCKRKFFLGNELDNPCDVKFMGGAFLPDKISFHKSVLNLSCFQPRRHCTET